MDRIWLVLKREFLYTVLTPQFLLLLFLIPLLPFFLYLMLTFALPESDIEAPEGQIVQMILEPGQPPSEKVEGVFDESGQITEVPPSLEERLLLFSTRDEANRALENGELDTLYVFAVDYLESGRVTAFRRDFNPLSGFMDSFGLSYLVYYNLLKDNQLLVERFAFPLEHLDVVRLDENSRYHPNDLFGFFVPYVGVLFFFTSLYGSASLMLNGLSNEKKNRVIEVLITSISPSQLITGKIIGLGLIGLLQIAVWLGILFFLNRLGGGILSFLAKVHLPLGVLVWGGLLFIPGYAIYAAFLAGIGIFVPNMKMATQSSLLVMMPLLLPLLSLTVMVRSPNGIYSILLSLFPLTSPLAMVVRLLLTDVPFWQCILALGILWGTVLVVLRLVSGLFRAQYLLYNQPFHWRVFVNALMGRA